MPALQFVVDRREAGHTLASVLKVRFGLSWSQAKRLVEGRHVKVSDQVEIDVARRLKFGKRVEIAAGTIEVRNAGGDSGRGEGVKGRKGDKAPEQPTRGQPSRTSTRGRGKLTPSPLHPFTPSPEVIYQDDAVVVVNKPSGLTTMRHKEEAAEFGERGKKFLPKTLADLLPTLLGTPDRPVIAVHRIDRDTSGLVVFARTRIAAERLTEQFRKHTVERRYLALTCGVPSAGRIESVLVRDRGDGRRGSTRKANPPDGKRSVTHVAVLEQLGEFAVVECRLETGRTHQVRIHLGEAGTPLCGETVYNRAVNAKPVPDASGAERPMLHAARLGFKHPESGEPVNWEVPPPEDFAAVLERVKRPPRRGGE